MLEFLETGERLWISTASVCKNLQTPQWPGGNAALFQSVNSAGNSSRFPLFLVDAAVESRRSLSPERSREVRAWRVRFFGDQQGVACRLPTSPRTTYVFLNVPLTSKTNVLVTTDSIKNGAVHG